MKNELAEYLIKDGQPQRGLVEYLSKTYEGIKDHEFDFGKFDDEQDFLRFAYETILDVPNICDGVDIL